MTTHRGLLHHMLINVTDVRRSSPFYTGMFTFLGYELAGAEYGEEYGYEDWKRWDLGTPHEISICQVRPERRGIPHVRGALGHHDHIAFCAVSREDVEEFHARVLLPLEARGLCVVEDAPCDCPEYGEGYYATFFLDPDGLKYEYVYNPNHGIKKALRDAAKGAGDPADRPD